MATTLTKELVPAGTWTADAAHSNASFEIEHASVSVFRGAFKPVGAKLVSGDDDVVLEGAVDVETITIDDEQIRPHLLSPEFFDAERFPQVSYRSTGVSGSADALEITGELTIAGATLPVRATGSLRGPVELPGGGEKLALSLEASIDRTAYGMDWQMDLPSGEPILGNEVRLIVELEFNREV